MTTLGGAMIQSANANTDGRVCALCGQIAFKIVVIKAAGVEVEVPLCGHHYIEAQRKNIQPEGR